NDFMLNTLLLDFDGWVHLAEEDINMELAIKNKGNDFSQIMSLIPGIYGDQFKDIESSGNLTFEADAIGSYNAINETYPLFNLNLEIDNGAFKYANMSEKLESVFADVKIKNPTPDLKALSVNASRLDFVLAGEKFE